MEWSELNLEGCTGWASIRRGVVGFTWSGRQRGKLLALVLVSDG